VGPIEPYDGHQIYTRTTSVVVRFMTALFYHRTTNGEGLRHLH